jgi:CDP-diacylglycerol---glycerol-3-phosphate 3-phosphatidyltransferase
MTDHPTTFSDRMRALTGGMMSRVGLALHRLGIHPDVLTILGLLLVGIAAIFIGRGDLEIGGLILLLALPFDALDGAVARAMLREGRFGEMLDSSLDRYADGFIFAALSYHFAQEDNLNMLVLTQVALLGTFMVSYARARATGVDVEVKIGLFTRLERTVVILVMLLVPQLLIPGLWVLAIGTNFTAMQRLLFVYKALK